VSPALDRFAGLDTIVHRWDTRWKLAAIGIAIVTLGIERPGMRQGFDPAIDLPPAIAGVALAFGLVLLARVPIAFTLRRLRVPAVFLALLVVVFAVTDEQVDTEVGPLSWSSTRHQLGVTIVLRALAMLVLVFPAIATAPMATTLKALRRLRVPGPIVELVFVTYRYLFVYREQLARVRTAMRARGFTPRLDLRTLRTIGNGLGVILVSSVDRTHRLSLAMRCRGWSGGGDGFRTLDDFETRGRDVALFAAMVAIAGSLVVWRWSA